MLGSIIGAALGRVQMTAVPQRTALSHAFGALCVTLVGTAEYYLQAPDVPPFTMAVLSAEVILGSLTFTGSLMAAGKLQEILPQRPITYKGQNIVNLSLLAVSVGVAVFMVFHPEQTEIFHILLVDSHALRHADDHPDRRRRHADGDLAPQFLRGTFRRGDGFRARQQALDRRRRARRGVGFHPFDEHVEGDESVVHERALRRVRPRANQGRGRRRGCAGQECNRRRGGGDPGSGQQGGGRAGLRHGGRPGAAQGARALSMRSPSAAWTSSSASIPSPAECPAT